MKESKVEERGVQCIREDLVTTKQNSAADATYAAGLIYRHKEWKRELVSDRYALHQDNGTDYINQMVTKKICNIYNVF